METTTQRNERLLDTHMTEYLRRERDLYRGYEQGIHVNVSFYTRKINRHRAMITKYANSLGITAAAVSQTLAALRTQHAA